MFQQIDEKQEGYLTAEDLRKFFKGMLRPSADFESKSQLSKSPKSRDEQLRIQMKIQHDLEIFSQLIKFWNDSENDEDYDNKLQLEEWLDALIS